MDAILGALGLPDIGQIFPDTDPRWRGAASSVFLKEAVSCCFFFVFFFDSSLELLFLNCLTVLSVYFVEFLWLDSCDH